MTGPADGAQTDPGMAVGGTNGDFPTPSEGPSVGGSVGIAGGLNGAQLSCTDSAPSTSQPVFEAEVVRDSAPARAELYSWLTDEEAVLLRAGKQLLVPLAQPSFNGAALQALALRTDPAVAQLATILGGEQFALGRSSWPEPWATRTTVSSSNGRANLLRILLKPEAWVAVLANGNLQVYDQQNHLVSTADAAATPTRIGAIYHARDVADGGPDCNSPPVFTNRGYREFVVSNSAMVQEWSLGTEVIKDRLRANIDQLTEFFARTRACPLEISATFWNQDVVCSWAIDPVGVPSEQFAYLQALAIPNDEYSMEPRQLAALIDTLQGDLFEIDPLVVTPGSP